MFISGCESLKLDPNSAGGLSMLSVLAEKPELIETIMSKDSIEKLVATLRSPESNNMIFMLNLHAFMHTVLGKLDVKEIAPSSNHQMDFYEQQQLQKPKPLSKHQRRIAELLATLLIATMVADGARDCGGKNIKLPALIHQFLERPGYWETRDMTPAMQDAIRLWGEIHEAFGDKDDAGKRQGLALLTLVEALFLAMLKKNWKPYRLAFLELTGLSAEIECLLDPMRGPELVKTIVGVFEGDVISPDTNMCSKGLSVIKGKAGAFLAGAVENQDSLLQQIREYEQAQQQAQGDEQVQKQRNKRSKRSQPAQPVEVVDVNNDDEEAIIVDEDDDGAVVAEVAQEAAVLHRDAIAKLAERSTLLAHQQMDKFEKGLAGGRSKKVIVWTSHQVPGTPADVFFGLENYSAVIAASMLDYISVLERPAVIVIRKWF